MNVLLIGSGAREHAFAWKICQSPLCTNLYVAPGNPGIGEIALLADLDIHNFAEIYEFVTEKSIDLVVIGPEQPLVEGLADFLHGLNVAVIGPGKAGAMLEGSKEFSKSFMRLKGITTAAFQAFHSFEKDTAIAYMKTLSLPLVIKASGLAAGKGVVIVEDYETGEKTIRKMLSGSLFGLAGKTIVIEEFLAGKEISVFILTDGKDYILLPTAKDYKRVGEGDTGANTGGMGAVCPVPFVEEKLIEKIKEKIINPTLKGLQEEEIFYCGFVFFGLMIVKGEPYLLEYNCRMGDPETEVVLPMIESDFLELLWSAAKGNIATQTVSIREGACATVMLVSGGYPQDFEKGKAISGTENIENSLVFHAGTRTADSQLLTNGGRVLALTSFGKTLQDALTISYENAGKIQFEGKYFRKDIGKDVL